MKFRHTWFSDMDDDGTLRDFFPGINLNLTARNGDRIPELFVIDSGAAISMAPRRLCEQLGIPWEDGAPMVVQGISPQAECDVMGRIHLVEIYIPEIDRELVLPICFASGDTANLLGRRVFFDAFRIEFDQPYRTTTFEYLLEESE